jgi:hypothetical protein
LGVEGVRRDLGFGGMLVVEVVVAARVEVEILNEAVKG